MPDQIKPADEADLLAAVGQESETKAVKHVQEYTQIRKDLDIKFENEMLEKLAGKAKYTRMGYHRTLATALVNVASRVMDLPKGWGFKSICDEKGVGVMLIAPNKKVYAKAFKPTGIGQYDLEAVGELCQMAQNFLDTKYDESLKTPSGIYLPEKLVT